MLLKCLRSVFLNVKLTKMQKINAVSAYRSTVGNVFVICCFFPAPFEAAA